MRLVGARAQNWLRQEKSYRAFGVDLGRDATPAEAGLSRLIDGPGDADPWGREALYHAGNRVGRLTSGGYSVVFGKSIGMGYVPPELVKPDTGLEVRMLDRLWPVEVMVDSAYDPKKQTLSSALAV